MRILFIMLNIVKFKLKKTDMKVKFGYFLSFPKYNTVSHNLLREITKSESIALAEDEQSPVKSLVAKKCTPPGKSAHTLPWKICIPPVRSEWVRLFCQHILKFYNANFTFRQEELRRG